jgi:hypothetical protein
MLKIAMDEPDPIQEPSSGPPVERVEPPSIQAFAVDTSNRESFEAPSSTSSSVDLEPDVFRDAQARRTRRLGILVGVPLVGCVAILGLAAARDVRHGSTGETARTPTTVEVAAAAVPASSPTSSSDLPPLLPDGPSGQPAQAPAAQPVTTPAPAASPSVATATIKVSSAKLPLTVDGKRVKGSSVDVPCGSHFVAVGKEKPHKVDAACGSTVVADAPRPHEVRRPGGKRAAPHGHSRERKAKH